MNATRKATHSRAYRLQARAEAAEASSRRIVESFLKRAESEWFDKIKLDDVAADAGVTVQTVIRKFGGKQGLLDAAHHHMGEAIHERRRVAPGDLNRAVDVLADDYEAAGRLILRLLDQEEMHPVLKPTIDIGRREHRRWLGEVFEQNLAALTPSRREAMLDSLVVAADLYVWKLMRIDMGRSIPAYKKLVRQMLHAALSV